MASKIDATICEVMEISAKLADLALHPKHNETMQDLTRKLGAALRRQALAVEAEGVGA